MLTSLKYYQAGHKDFICLFLRLIYSQNVDEKRKYISKVLVPQTINVFVLYIRNIDNWSESCWLTWDKHHPISYINRIGLRLRVLSLFKLFGVNVEIACSKFEFSWNINSSDCLSLIKANICSSRLIWTIWEIVRLIGAH